MYQTAIVLSHLLEPDLTLSQEARSRVEAAVQLQRIGLVDTLTMSGGYSGTTAWTNPPPITHAEAMAKYAQECGATAPIHLEPHSIDTVGQAFFTKQGVVQSNGWRKLMVVSQAYHIPRASKIFNFVYGEGFEIGYFGVKGPNDRAVVAKERQSMRAFKRTFAGVELGNDEKITGALVERHPLYRVA